jgi:hypothetical protein
MAEEESSGRGAPVAGIILVFLGVVLLLMTTGYLPWELWRTLWRFWPVLIIIAGLNILLRNLSPWLLSLLILLILTGCVVVAVYQSGYPLVRETISIPAIMLQL